MDALRILELSASISVIVAEFVFIKRPRLFSLWLFVLSSILWISYGIVSNMPFMTIQCIVLLIFNILTIRNWKREGIKF